jgi:glutamate synthase (NADPH/NADH) small chain
VRDLVEGYDAVVLTGGAEHPRDLPVPGRDLEGIYYAMEFLPLQNRRVAGDQGVRDLWASDKHVIIIGGGDTGSDCVGTSNRHGAKSVTQFELLAKPETVKQGNPVWPYWPAKLRTSSSHEEGAERDWAVSTKAFKGEDGKVNALVAVRVEWKKDPANGQVKMQEVPGSEFELPADLVLLAMGFVGPVHKGLLDELGVQYDARGNVKATTDGEGCYRTSVDKVFAAGDMRRGQSLVVWAIREGRQCAREVDAYLMGQSELPR